MSIKGLMTKSYHRLLERLLVRVTTFGDRKRYRTIDKPLSISTATVYSTRKRVTIFFVGTHFIAWWQQSLCVDNSTYRVATWNCHQLPMLWVNMLHETVTNNSASSSFLVAQRPNVCNQNEDYDVKNLVRFAEPHIVHKSETPDESNPRPVEHRNHYRYTTKSSEA